MLALRMPKQLQNRDAMSSLIQSNPGIRREYFILHKLALVPLEIERAGKEANKAKYPLEKNMIKK